MGTLRISALETRSVPIFRSTRSVPISRTRGWSLGTLVLLLLSVLAARPASAADNDRAPAARQLHALFDAEWQRGLRENPIGATYVGDTRFNSEWPDYSPAALTASHAADQAALQRLDRIDPAQLSAADRLNRDLFRRQTQASLDAYSYGSQYLPLSQRSGLT